LSTAAVNLFALSCPIGSIVDLSVSFTLSNIQGALQETVASGSLGNVYYLALDGPSANTYIPLGLPTTS
jgi:hypothetical protein